MGNRRNAVAGILLAFALLAASCGSDEVEDSESTDVEEPSSSQPTDVVTPTEAPTTEAPTPTEPVRTASYRGVSEDAIKIGIVLFDLDVILSLGVDVGFGDQEAHYQLLIDEMNEAGGILGRRIDPVFRFISPVDPAESDRVCEELVADEEVFVVLGTLRPPDNVLCYTELNDTPFIGAPSGDLADEVFERSLVPFIYPGRIPSRTDVAIIAALELDDAIDGGVIAVHGADGSRIDSIAATLEELGAAKIVKTVELADEADQTELADELDRFVQKFKAEGATGVINLGNNVAFLAAFNRAAYDIPVWTTGADVLADFIYDQGATDDELRLVRLIGSASASDLYEAGHEPTVECIDRWNTARPDELALTDPGDDDLSNFGVVLVSCMNLHMLDAAATAAGLDLTVESLTGALDSIGSFEMAGLRFASLSSTKWDASDSAQLSRWSEAAGEIVPAEDLDLG